MASHNIKHRHVDVLDIGGNRSHLDRDEVRVVEHKPPFYYEVWIFNDELSKRSDGTSGISLILTFPPTGGTDINLIGNCHA